MACCPPGSRRRAPAGSRLCSGHEKRAARGCKRPKSREETPKEGGGNAKCSRYRAATICQCVAQKARGIDLFAQLGCRRPICQVRTKVTSLEFGIHLRATRYRCNSSRPWQTSPSLRFQQLPQKLDKHLSSAAIDRGPWRTRAVENSIVARSRESWPLPSRPL